MNWLVDAAYAWYTVMSAWSAAVGEPVQRALGSQSMPGLSALLLGLLGGLAPCQITANAGAIAYVTQASQKRQSLWLAVRDFLGGKVLVYVLLGFLAAMIGFRLPTPIMAALRKFSGPLMILIGLYLFGWLRWRSGTQHSLTAWIQSRTPKWASPPFWLGIAFSLGFCPTMAVIFFGALVPLVIRSQAGMVLPVLFAIGTALPVIVWAGALSAGREAGKRWVRGARNVDRYVRVGAAVVFIVSGVNDTILYWLV